VLCTRAFYTEVQHSPQRGASSRTTRLLNTDSLLRPEYFEATFQATCLSAEAVRCASWVRPAVSAVAVWGRVPCFGGKHIISVRCKDSVWAVSGLRFAHGACGNSRGISALPQAGIFLGACEISRTRRRRGPRSRATGSSRAVSEVRPLGRARFCRWGRERLHVTWPPRLQLLRSCGVVSGVRPVAGRGLFWEGPPVVN
jgi:hypothetical protein